MDFISNKKAQIEEMLKVLGKKDVLELFSAIPPSILLPAPVEDDGLSEYEGLKLMEKISSQNSFPALKNYLGAGAYEHHIPALVAAVTSKSEFLTSYTPYQAEVSQGMLQIIFEYQSAITALTGFDVANASVWDGASAVAEGVLMAMRIQKERKELVVFETLLPQYKAVLDQYLLNHDVAIKIIPLDPNGQADLHKLKAALNDQTIAVLLQSPNSLGVLENVTEISKLAHEKGALVIQAGNLLAYGIYAPPGETGVDIAVGDSQPFGLSLNFGGPYAGYMATKTAFQRQIPGRLVAEAKDSQGRTGYVLALQAREQHIRREKALSNICTNQALAALSSLVAILYYGKEGVKELALTNFERASYLKSHFPDALAGPSFNEVAIKFKRPLSEVQCHFRKNGIEPGWISPLFKDRLIVAVTETKSKEDLDHYVEVAHDYI